MSRATNAALRKLIDVDWASWCPVDRATLTFVIRDSRILLIRKKRGLGAGKINGPGGRIEPGESPLECAIREVQEELRVTPSGLDQRGELRFQFTDGYSIHVFVFSATDCHGQARETEEAIPLWTALDAIPYDEMWADDVLWLPRLLAGHSVAGRFIFDGDALLDHDLADAPAGPKSVA
jgi:8-oxo-dGTP diphosphatase